MSIFAALTLIQTACPAGAEPVPPALAAWRTGAAVTAAAGSAGVPSVPIGAAVELSLHPAAHLTLPAPPQRAAPAASHGGLAAIDLPRAGRVRVALSNASWIELIGGGRPVASTGHGHGPRCSGIRKIVDFDLPAGRHLIQLSGSPDAALRLMVVPGG